MNLPLFTIVLRIFHIFGGMLWFGAVVIFVLYIEPSTREAGPASGPFMAGFAVKRRFPVLMVWASIVSVAGGLIPYWRDSAGLRAAWLTSPTGTALTIGALAGLSAGALGLFISKPAGDRMLAAMTAAAAKGDPPSPEQAQDIEKYSARLRRAGTLGMGLLTPALLMMATARYL
jgi:hypothetical protein